MISNVKELTYDTMLELTVKNMGEFVGHTKSCCNIAKNTSSILRAMKENVKNDKFLDEQKTEDISLQIDEALSMLGDTQENMFSNVDCLRGQLQSLREIHDALKSAGMTSSDVSVELSFVEKALAPKNEN